MNRPVVSGIAACLVQQFRRTFAGEDPTAATMKSILIHTARGGGSQRGPDYRFGWGLVDAQAAAKFIADQGTDGRLILLDAYSDSFMEYPIEYAGTGPIRVTLAWTDPPGIPVYGDREDDTPNLVNDLDLHVFGPDGAHYAWTLDPSNPTLPARRDRENHRDNVEQVLIESPVPGSYAIWIVGQVNLGSSQEFALCISGLRPGAEVPRIIRAEIVSPARGDGVSSEVPIRAHVHDNLGASRIVFKVDGAVVDEVGTDGIEGEIDITPPQTETRQTVRWDTTTASNGSHTIEVMAVSIDGLTCYRSHEVFVCNENEGVVPLTLDGPAESESISPSGDEDWFSFETLVSATYTVETLRLPNLEEHPDTIITLYGPDSLSVPIFVNDDGGSGHLSSVTQVLEANRVYHVKVSGYSTSTGFYRIRLRREPDNRSLPIVPLEVDGPRVWGGPIAGGSEHLYTFQTGAFGIHSIEIAQSPASESVPPKILLYTANDEKAFVGSARPGHPLRRALSAHQVYLVRVVPSNALTDRYLIGVDTLATVPPVYVRPDAIPGGNGLSWERAFESIGTALEVMWATGEIWVVAGRYRESVRMEPGLALYGGFLGIEETREERDWVANETVIDAAGLDSAAVIGADGAMLDGFTITGGERSGVDCRNGSSLALTNCTITENTASSGGGMYCSGSSPTLTNCTISGNRATGWEGGGGVYCDGKSSPTLTDCTISGNTASDGGGVYCFESSPTLTNCTVTGNTADRWGGGGVSYSESSPTLTNCTISENAGTGVECWGGSSTTLTNCTIAENTRMGMEYRGNSLAMLTSCTIEGNVGDGVRCWDYSSATLANCIIAGNTGGGISCSGESSATLTNCILWNTGRELLGSAVALYSNIEGGRGEGNIDTDPLFVDPENGDYHLRNDSPCIDSGLVSAAPGEDAEGRSRPGRDGLVDMGAYESPPEYEPGEQSPSPGRVYVRADAVPGGDGLSWEGAFSSIGAALRAIWTDGEVWVAAGSYPESIEMETGVALYGGFSGIEESHVERDWTAHETIVDATGLGSAAVIGANGAILDGFTVTGGEYCGVNCRDGSSPTLANCTVTRNSGRGVDCWDNSSPTLTNCTISGNSGGGVYCSRSSPTLTNCTITGNTAWIGGGVYCSRSSATLIHCTIAGNMGGGVYCTGDSSATLTNCISWNPGLELLGSAVALYSNIEGGRSEVNIDADPLFVDPENGDYRLRNGSPCIDSGLLSMVPSEDADGRSRPGGDGLVDMGAYESPPEYEPGEQSPSPGRVYVRSDAHPGGDGLSWEGAFSSIGAALRMIWADGEVWVAAGSYPESVEMETGVALYGGFSGIEESREERDWAAHETIVDATGFDSAAVFGANGAILDGFIVTGGYGGVDCFESSPTLANCTITGNATDWQGGGVYCSASSPTLTNCTIAGNVGGGVHCQGDSSPTLPHCTIAGNTGSGVYCDDESSPTLTNCTIANNIADYGGGGVLCERRSSPVLTQCTITGNTAIWHGGGVYCWWESSPTLANCTINGNTAESGGGVKCSRNSSPTLTHCTIAGNTAERGGGVECWESSPTLTNCTINGNTAESGGGVYCMGDPSPRLTHCTIAGNTAENGGGMHSNGSSSPWLTNCILWNTGSDLLGFVGTMYSNIESGWGKGNIYTDPLFVDPANGDYHLQEGSPCIDAGEPDGAFNDACLPPGLGTERCDMGAYGGPLNCAWLEPQEPVAIREWELY